MTVKNAVTDHTSALAKIKSAPVIWLNKGDDPAICCYSPSSREFKYSAIISPWQA